MSTINYAEDLFEAISTIVEKRISNLEFDKTIICTITDTSKATTQNLYTVTDGSISFEVQSNGGTYAINDQVRVSIVNGDFSKDKFIQGKYNAADATKPITYVSPLNSVVKITDNLLTGSSETHGIAANGSVEEISVGEIIFDEDMQNKDLFDTLYLSAEFQTNFDQYKMQQGSYGLHIMFAIEKNEGEYDRLDIYFDIMDMFGNPYAFKIFTQQEIKYNFSEQLEGLVGAKIYLYQNNDFQYLSEIGNKENYTPTEINGNVISDIFVKNIVFGFGSEVTSISERKLKLYTNDESKYRADGTETEAVTKNLKLLWYNSDINNMYIGFSDGEWTADDKGKYNYDEEDYLLAAAANTRLLSRKTEAYPDDEVSLGLAADIYDIKNEALKAYKLIGKDIKDLLKSFQEYTENAKWETEHPADALLATGNDAENSLATYAKSIADTSTELENLYNNILTQAKKIKKSGQEDFIDIDFPTSDPHLNFAVDIDAVNDAVDAVFTTSESTLTNSAWDGIYTNYNNQWKTLKEQLEKIKTNLNTRSGLLNISTNYEKLKQILENKASNLSDTPYLDLTKNEDFIKKWDNKYCLYWYRYTKDLTLKDRFMSTGWERIDEFTNKGLPGKDDDTDYLQQKLPASESSIISPGLRAQNEEKFKILLFYNHEQIQSNELIFENLIEFPDAATVNAAASIKINNKNDKTQDTYQLYNATGWLINTADAQVKRELIAEYDGAIGGNEKLIGHTIKWSVPKSATMIDIFDSEVNQFTITSDESYTHYSKVIGANPTDETKVNEAHLVFPYHIKNYYQQTAARNTILCNVDTWYGAKSITFTSFGTSGTDYTLVLLTNPQQPMVIDDDEKPLSITTKLYDYDNNEINATPNYSWEGPTGYKYDNEKGQITKDGEKSGVYAGILTATIENDKLKLSTQLTVPYGCNENYYIEGANSIIYDSNGGNPQYYKKSYVLYSKIDGNTVSNVTWSLEYYKGTSMTPFTATKTVDKDKVVSYTLNGEDATTEKINEYSLNYLPYLTSENILVPSPMYLTYAKEEQRIYTVAIAKNTEGVVLWAQPILIYQNAYSSSILNKWDGGLSIDKENGTILSTMVGAGRKNKDNKFEGVLMGDVATTSGDNTIIKTGLYGFHDGAQSFGFKVDGTAFIGKSGRGRLEFNGNSGTITSANFNLKDGNDPNKDIGTGLNLDFDDGYLQTKKNGKFLIKLDNNDYYLQTEDYKVSTYNPEIPSQGETGAGFKIDLASGVLDVYNFNFKGEASGGQYKGSYLKLGSDPNQNFIEARYVNTNTNTILKTLEIGKNTYLLNSFDWKPNEAGMQINLGEGIICAYSQDAQEGLRAIQINSSSNSIYPLSIGNPKTPVFKVRWNGSISIKDTVFNVNSDGDLWIRGVTANDAAVAVTNTGVFKATNALLNEITVSKNANFSLINLNNDDLTAVSTFGTKSMFTRTAEFTDGIICSGGGIYLNTTTYIKEPINIIIEKDTYSTKTDTYDVSIGLFKRKLRLQFKNGFLTGGIVVDETGNPTTDSSNDQAAADIDAATYTALVENVNTNTINIASLTAQYEILNSSVTTLSETLSQDYLSKTEAQQKYLTKESLSNYYTKDNIDNKLTNYVLNTTLTDYATSSDLIKLYGAESIPNENPLTIAGNASAIAEIYDDSDETEKGILIDKINELLERIEALERYHSGTEEEPAPEPTE